MRTAILLPVLLVGCGRMNALNGDWQWTDSGWVSLEDTADSDEADADADADSDSDADADSDADSDADADADSDADSDSDADTDPPSPPVLTGFTASDAGNGQVRVQFVASDPNDDMTTFLLTVNGTANTLAIPGQITSWNPGGTSSILWNVGASSGCGTASHTFGGRITDALGLHSSTQTATASVGGGTGATFVATTETGDTETSPFDAGTLGRPATITGDIYLAAYYLDPFTLGYYYDGDIDFIRFTPCQSGTFSFSLTWVSATGDYDLALIDGGFTQILAYSEQAGSAQPESFSYALTANTSYYLRVAGFEGGAGAWTVAVQ